MLDLPARNRQQPRLPTLSRLPPLTALRAFVVAARHASFSRAADELHVSTTAIGQQVRILETHLGQTLFSRQRGELTLTEAGAALYPGLADAFDGMVESVSSLIRVHARATLHLTVESAFAAKLLAPRLGRLRQGLAEVELSISTLESGRFDPSRFEDDCAIMAIAGPVPGFHCLPLFNDAVIAACTPDFAARQGLMGSPEKLRDPGVDLLRDAGEDPAFDWGSWVRACGIAVRPSQSGLRFSHQTMLLEATLAGHGVALIRHSLISDDLANGRLVSPFGTPQPTPSRYHLITSAQRSRDADVQFLVALLRDEPQSLGTVS